MYQQLLFSIGFSRCLALTGGLLLLCGCSFPLHTVSLSPLAEIVQTSETAAENPVPIKPVSAVAQNTVRNVENSESENTEQVEYSDEHKRLEKLLAQDHWMPNVELRNWFERQRAQGEIPSKKGLIASPNNPQQNKKGNAFAEFNRSGKATPVPTHYTIRDTEAAQRGPISLYRWYHGEIETELLRSDTQSLKYTTAHILLDTFSQSPVATNTTTNAAILLARLGVVKVKPFLHEAVLAENLSQPIRCAALESLGHLSSCSNEELLQLIERFQEREVRQPGSQISSFQPGNPDLVIELLESLSERLEPTDASCFTTALKSRSSAVRLTAVLVWRDHIPSGSSTVTCPDEIIRLVVDPSDEQIRISALLALARWKHPSAERYVPDGLCDAHVKVRIAAIDALGILGGEASLKHLRDHVRDQAPQIRVHVAAAFRKMNQKEDLFRMAEDESYEVRMEVAKGLDDPVHPATSKWVEKMLTDTSSRVQKTVLESLAHWSLEESAPILFEALASQSQQKRETASQVLALSWPKAETFDYNDRRTDLRKEALKELQAAFHAEFGQGTSGQRVMEKQPGNDVIPAYFSSLSETVLESFADWENATTLERRKILGQVLSRAKQGSFDAQTLQRLFHFGVRETDMLTLLTFLQIFEHCPGETAGQFAIFHLGNDSPEIRRRSCLLLGDSGNPHYLQELVDVLDDVAPEVVVTALNAIGALEKGHHTHPQDQAQALPRDFVERICTVLLRPELQLQIAAATALSQWNQEEGILALERLGRSGNPQARLAVAQTAGSLTDPRLIPLLISYLDEGGSIRQASLNALPKLAGEDYGNPTGAVAVSITEQIGHWKQWSKNRKGIQD